MKSDHQIQESIARFQHGFWGRERIDHPPVGIAPNRGWLPISYLKDTFPRPTVQPEDVSPTLVRTDYEDAAFGRRVISDDWLPFNAAWRAVPWLEAICGCGVNYATGSLAPSHIAAQLEDLAQLPFPASAEWSACLQQQTAYLVENNPRDCWVSPTILRGPSDVLSALRGLTNFYLDIYDNPALVAQAARRINQVFGSVLADHFAAVPPHLGGYGYIYGYWAPGPTVVIQEDALGMCSPNIYRDIFMELNAEIVRQLPPYTLFHLHSTGYRHYKHVMTIPGLTGLEITVEANGPTLLEMVPHLRAILEQTRLILFVDDQFDTLPQALKKIPHEGLYLIISDKFMHSEQDFRQFITANFEF